MNWASVWWGFWQHAVTYTFLSNWCVDTRWPCLSGHPIEKNTFVYLYLSRWFWASTPRSATEISTNHISDASWQEPPAHSAKKLLHCNIQFSSILGISFIHLQMYFFTMNKKCVSKLFTGSVFYPLFAVRVALLPLAEGVAIYLQHLHFYYALLRRACKIRPHNSKNSTNLTEQQLIHLITWSSWKWSCRGG